MGYLNKESSEKTGLPEKIPVINGGSDHSVAELGSGMLSKGTVSCILGTAGVMAACTDKPFRDEKKRVMCWSYPLEGLWDILGVTQTAASSLTWFRNTFDSEGDENIFERYSKMAEEVPCGSQGLFFLPYLLGERTPHWNPDAKGVFFGIQMKHGKSFFIRAVMEGVAFSLRESFEIMKEKGISFESVCLMGGGSKSPVWKKILADVLNKPVKTLISKDTGATGNLILTALALGYISSPEEALKFIREEDSCDPVKECSKKYDNNFNKYKEIYRLTHEIMGETEE